MRRVLFALVLLAAACSGDDGAGSDGPVDADRMADALDELGYDCSPPEEDHDGSTQVCEEDGQTTMLGFTYTDVEGRDGRLDAEQELVCAGPDEAFLVWAVGENWIAEPIFEITELTPGTLDAMQSDAEDAAQAVADELGGEVRVVVHTDC